MPTIKIGRCSLPGHLWSLHVECRLLPLARDRSMTRSMSFGDPVAPPGGGEAKQHDQTYAPIKAEPPRSKVALRVRGPGSEFGPLLTWALAPPAPGVWEHRCTNPDDVSRIAASTTAHVDVYISSFPVGSGTSDAQFRRPLLSLALASVVLGEPRIAGTAEWIRTNV